MKEPNNFEEIEPGRPTAAELRAMALRQQQQIDSQHQLLAAKEQRLRFLKAQEARGAAAAAEGERLRRLRERVEAQESKLRRLRALRGQVDLQKTYNVTLGNDLDSIRALFSEKEKELTLAVAKVEALTRQLEDLRRDRRGPINLMPGANSNQQLGSSPAARELEKLRRELMYRNQLSLQQDARLHLQREELQQRQAELRSVDQRILELQSRLNKKKASNLVQQQQQHSPTQSPTLNHSTSGHIRSSSTHVYPQQRVVPRGNIVAVEPYNHTPHKSSINALTNNANKANILNNNNQTKIIQDFSLLKLQQGQNSPNSTNSNDGIDHNMLALESDENKLARQKQQEHHHHNKLMLLNNQTNNADLENDIKNNSTFQTLPYNNNSNTSIEKVSPKLETNHGIKSISTVSSNPNFSNNNHMRTNECDSEKAAELNDVNNKHQLTTTVHSMPLNLINKSVAVPISNTGNASSTNNYYPEETSKPVIKPKAIHHLSHNQSPNSYNNHMHNIPSGNLVVPPRKPISSVAPTLAPKIIAHSPKVNMVAPQAQNRNHQQSPSSELLDKLRPALPPKPNKSMSQQQVQQEYNEATTTAPPTVINVINKMHAQTENKIEAASNNNVPTATINNNNAYAPASASSAANADNLPIKAKPLTIKKQPLSEQPKLKSFTSNVGSGGFKPQQQQHYSSRRIEMPPSFLFPEIERADLKLDKNSSASNPSQSNNENTTSTTINHNNNGSIDDTDKSASTTTTTSITTTTNQPTIKKSSSLEEIKHVDEVIRRKRNIIAGISDINGKIKLARRVSFDPLALLLDASLEGELELVKKTAMQVPNPSAANDEGITALHNAICAGHVEIVRFLVEFGCDVNAQDSDGWTPLHCAASCNNLSMVKFLVESGACLFAATLSDHETPAEKCEEDEEGFDGCSEYLYSIQEKLGILNTGEVYSVFAYDAQQPDELGFAVNDRLTILRKGDEAEREWWWARNCVGKEGYVPRNLLGLYPRISPSNNMQSD